MQFFIIHVHVLMYMFKNFKSKTKSTLTVLRVHKTFQFNKEEAIRSFINAKKRIIILQNTCDCVAKVLTQTNEKLNLKVSFSPKTFYSWQCM